MKQDTASPRTKATQVWSSDTGNEPWQYASPRALDGTLGNALALVPKSDTILVANFRYLLRINAQTGREEVLRISLRDPKYAPVIEIDKTRRAQTTACFIGLACHVDKIYALVETYKSDLLLVLNERGEVLQSYSIGQPGVMLPYINERSRQVFPSLRQELIRLRFIPPDNLFAFVCEFDRNGVNTPYTVAAGSLLQYTLEPSKCRLKRQWRSITGYAVSSSGEVLVSGAPLFRLGVNVVAPPAELEPHHWSLIGVDMKGLFYWRSLRLVREKVNGKSFAIALTRVACSSQDKRLLWQLELDGSQGVLAHFAPHMTTYANGWLEVAEDGTLWVFMVHLDMTRIKDTVGIYKVQVLT